MAQATLTEEEIDALIAAHIEPHGDPRKRDRGEYWLKERGVPVWAIIGYLQGGGEGDIDVVASDYGVSREAVEATIAYYERNKALVDARLMMNRVHE